MKLDRDAAVAVVQKLADELGLGLLEATAEGILTIANSNMARAIRSRTIEKGNDPREFALVAFGGAGPLHAAEVADLLEIPEVLVPPYPGITSAGGLLTSDLKYDQMRTVFQMQGSDRRRAAQPRARRARRRCCAAGSSATASTRRDIEVIRALDCRYVGQGYELRVTLDGRLHATRALEQFHRLHEREYGSAYGDPIEIVNARVTAIGKRPALEALPGLRAAASRRRSSARARATSASTATLQAVTSRLYDRHAAAARRAARRARGRLPPRHDDRRPARLDGHGGRLRQPDPDEGRCPMSAVRTRVDPVTAAVIAGALDSIAVEMGHKLARMAYSSIIRESEDFGCVLCDAQGRQLCESAQSTPLQSGPIPGYIAGINRRFGELGLEWKPGDVVIHNHAYYGASHQPDVGFVVPVFYGGELVGFSATTAHHLDLGALTPGSCGIVDATDAFAEGLQFNAIKIEEEGRKNEFIWQILRDNCRAPQLVVGDMEAQVVGLQDRRRPLRRADRALRPRDGAERLRGPDGLLRPDAAAGDREAPRRHLRGGGPSRRLRRAPRRALQEPEDQGHADRRRLGDDGRPHGHRPAGRPADQHAARRHGRHRDLGDAALDPARRLDARSGADELGPLPRDHDRRARGLPREPVLPGAHDRPLLRRQHHRGHAHARARAGAAGGRRRGRRQPQGRRLLRLRRRPALGLHGHPGGRRTAGATGRTGSTPSTRSTPTRATTRSRTSSRTSRCA